MALSDDLQWFAPSADERAVLSALLVGSADGSKDRPWHLVAGSLLTSSREFAATSPQIWARRQPGARHFRVTEEPDFGPIFTIDPFPGIRLVRQPLRSHEWASTIDGLAAGRFRASLTDVQAEVTNWGPAALVSSGVGGTDDMVTTTARRPVRAKVAKLNHPEIPDADAIWTFRRRPPWMAYSRMEGPSHLNEWAEKLVGVSWVVGHSSPAAAFAIGRTRDDVWLTDFTYKAEDGLLEMKIAWNEWRVDPLSCAVHVGSEHDGMPIWNRIVRITDYPVHPSAGRDHPEPRSLPWDRRHLTFYVPRGARRTESGVQLLGPDGEVFDYVTVARRVEQVRTEIRAGTDDGPPASTSVSGDRKPAPTHLEQDDEDTAARRLQDETLTDAARRRFSTLADMGAYLRGRFAFRAGELLVLDPWLFGDATAGRAVLSFLEGFDRPIRALTSKAIRGTAALLTEAPWLAARQATAPDLFHDRIWIVGDSGLMVGASVNGFVATGAVQKASTAAELPYADTRTWREHFEQWWSSARAIV